ncbi:MAG: FadR/GntR family transcriptional regulator [Chloroflexota bacterium]
MKAALATGSAAVTASAVATPPVATSASIAARPAAAPTYRGRVSRRGLHQEVVHRLGLAIVRGEYAAGETLPRADDLAVELGVSRTVLREGMKVLAEKGLVEARQRSGTRVRRRAEWNLVDPDVIAWRREAGPDLEFLRQLSEVRLVVETDAARLAAERATDADLARIGELVGIMESQVADVDRYAAADLELHAAILQATNNPLLAQLADTLSEGLVASREVTRHRPGGPAYSLPLHIQLVERIRARDGAGAEAAMAELIRRSVDDIELVLAPPIGA